MLDILALALFTLAVYAALAWLGSLYSKRTGWQPPAGSPNPDSPGRRNFTLGLGAVSAVVGAVCCALWVNPWPARLLMGCETALLAAAGASDLRRFQLPLPFTLLGIVSAVAIDVLAQWPTFVLLFALAWAFVVMLVHALTSKGSMQLGDHIATLWIALAAPFNGLIAVAAGDFANVVLARVKDLRGKKVAAAGAWLIFAAVFAALPPYLTWFARAPHTSVPQNKAMVSEAPTVAVPAYTVEQAYTAETLITLSQWAGDHAGRVGLLTQRNARVAEAKQQADEIARYAAAAQTVAPGSAMTQALSDLASALRTYNVALVRDASERMAQQRTELEPIAAARPTPPLSVDLGDQPTPQTQ
jgi:hypothetical protein